MSRKIFVNGVVHTLDSRRPKVQAVAVNGDRVQAIGSNDDARRAAGRDAQIIDLKGATVVPGLTDSHYHLSGVGERELTLNLEGLAGIEELLSKLKQRTDRAKPGEWVTGRGWIETHWKPPAFPTRQQLDTVSRDIPVFLTRADGHGGVANSKALELSGVTKSTPNPFGGEIMRDKNGEPTGMLLDSAMSLVRARSESVDPRQALAIGSQKSVELGWTQVHIAGNSYAEVDIVRDMIRKGEMKLRIYNAVRGQSEAGRLLKEGAIIGESGHRFTLRTIKLVIDGALGSKGAALLEPYADHDTSGFLTLRKEAALPLLKEALVKGIQIETHAIGDLANRTILDWYEEALAAVPRSRRKVADPRWRIEHAQIVHPDDVPRFKRLGVIPSMQPSHAIGDLHFAPSRIGIERMGRGYVWQKFLQTGSIIAGGSDAPVEKGDPLIEFYAAVARKDLKGYSGPGWHPEQKVDRTTALKMFTMWASYAAFEENLRGRLSPGMLADMTVFDRDIMAIPEAEILQSRCLGVVIAGEHLPNA